jgi:hypothetical protein
MPLALTQLVILISVSVFFLDELDPFSFTKEKG